MAKNAAAMPQLVRMNCRRLRPSRLALASANSRMRRSTRLCVSLCVGGRYSPFDTIWVGMGVAAEAVSAPATRRCSRSLSQVPIVVSSLGNVPMAARVRENRSHGCAGEQVLLYDGVNAPVAVDNLGDAEVDRNRHQRNRLVLGEPLGGHQERSHLAERIFQREID